MLIIKSLRLLNGIGVPSILSSIFRTKSSIGGLLRGFYVRKGLQMAFYVSTPLVKRIGLPKNIPREIALFRENSRRGGGEFASPKIVRNATANMRIPVPTRISAHIVISCMLFSVSASFGETRVEARPIQKSETSVRDAAALAVDDGPYANYQNGKPGLDVSWVCKGKAIRKTVAKAGGAVLNPECGMEYVKATESGAH